MIVDRRRSGFFANLGIRQKFALAYGLILILFTISSVLFTLGAVEVRQNSELTRESETSLELLDDAQIGMLNQQTGLRGYHVTLDPEHLEPYRSGEVAFDEALARLRDLSDNPVMQAGLGQLRADMRRWRTDIARPQLKLLEKGAVAQAQSIALTGTGNQIIAGMRVTFGSLRQHERGLLEDRSVELQHSLDRTRNTALIMLGLGILFGIASYVGTSRGIAIPLAELARLMTRLAQGESGIEIPYRDRRDEVGIIARGLDVFRVSMAELATREWSKARLAALSSALQPADTHEEFAQALVRQLADALGAAAGTLFLWNERSARLEPAGGYALGVAAAETGRSFRLGEGPVGQAAKDEALVVLRDLPDDYLIVRTGLGEARPRVLLLQPLLGREALLGVVELALFDAPDGARLEYLADASRFAALSLETLGRGLATLALLRQTQRHQEELQASEEALRTQQEELRATNEALREKSELLERQGQRLRVSEEELRSQAEELRATNSAIEHKADELRQQKQALEQAQALLEEKTIDLESASRYKSEFLANMSHELRTPLNSMLILSKSLADNDDRNLNAEQIESARIVYDSGRSLLSLINDILDLSKVEAGKMQAVVEEVNLAAFAGMIERNFRPVADDRTLTLSINLAPRLPPVIRTDAGKLNQILTNLLSNAFKFTQQGGVQVEIDRPDAVMISSMPALRAESSVMFRVSDSGIGIAPAKMMRMFQAFEQGDAGTSRRFGGTGLGLSICRGLTQLLGGEIRASSSEGQGAKFTVVIPEQLEAAPAHTPPERDASAALADTLPPPSHASTTPAPAEAVISDDVATILVIEDDAQFAEVIAGIARQRQYRTLVAHDGEAGLRLARRNRPSGILLDIGLPGMDGWQVMDALKADPATQGIPVHFISGVDEATRALAMGAASFLKKPVSRPEVAAMLDTLPKPKGGLRWRILVIDDYEPDRRLVKEMLRREPVDIAEAATAPEALARLESERFDLLILDLGLPGMDGFEFLERASKRGGMPPVVIHSGRELTREEALKLREHTDTIVMKNAPSPQRLLDEVTLFLHSIRRIGAPEAGEAQVKVPELAGRTVLVVDDDMRNIFALSKALRARGLKVAMAQDGRKAINQLENNADISIVLMDIMMPGMDGYEAMRLIRGQSQWQSLPIIAVSAKAMTGDREKCLQAGANDYCSKPIDIDQLVEQIKHLLA